MVVAYVDTGSKRVDSYRATAEVYVQNSRIPGSRRLVQRYVITQKIIDGAVCTRIDYEANPAMGISARTAIINRDEFILFDTRTREIQARMPSSAFVAAEGGLEGRLSASASIMGRLRVAELVNEAARLSYDLRSRVVDGRTMHELATPAALLLALPVAPGGTARSMRVFLDATRDLFAGSIQEILMPDGSIQKIAINPIYEEHEGIPIMVGSVTVVSWDVPGSLEADAGESPDLANAEPVTEAELAAKAAAGADITRLSPLSGDPGSPDYAVTQITMYSEMELNAVSDAVFDILF